MTAFSTRRTLRSDLFGLIRPGIMVQFRNGAEPLWSGVLDSIPSRYDKSPAAQHRATVTAYGLYSTLTEAPVADGSLSPESTAQAFCALLESIGEMGVPQTGTFATMARWWERGIDERRFAATSRTRRAGSSMRTASLTWASSPPATGPLCPYRRRSAG